MTLAWTIYLSFLGAAVLLILVLGIYPQLLIGLFNATVVQWVENLKL